MTFDISRVWEGVLAGDPVSWRRLVTAYAPLVFTVVRRVGLDLPDAEDCAQQTWLALYRRRKAIVQPAALPGWLIRTAHRKALTIRQRYAPQLDLQSALQQPDAALLPDELIISLEQAAGIRLAVEQLDPRCRKLMSVMFLADDGKSYADMAEGMEIKPNSLGPLRSRCLEKLKRNLEKLGFDPD